MSESASSRSQYTAFRQAEKHFKNRAIKGRFPSIRRYQQKLFDLSRPDRQEDDPVWIAGWWSPENDEDVILSTKKSAKGKQREKGERPQMTYPGLRTVTLDSQHTGYVVAPGCILVPGYLTVPEQLQFLHASLNDYTRAPNPLSLSTHYQLPVSLFDVFTTAPNTVVLPKHLTRSDAETAQPKSLENIQRGRALIETEPASVLGYDEIIARNKTWTGDIPSEKLNVKTAAQLMTEIRWANLGWVYQWSTKSYDFSREKPIPFPPALASLCSKVVSSIPWQDVFTSEQDRLSFDWSSWPTDYEPDTGIVNFYQLNDTLMAHVDRSELDPARPLVSISLGHAAILLLGSASRDDAPCPIILRSGDCLIMSGEGRQAYHGVPRILEGTLPVHFQEVNGDALTMKAAKRFISTARINVNARQVFPPGFAREGHTST